MIATDHAPHSAEEKSKGLKNSAFGIVGLETAFSVLYTELVKKNIISLEKLVELMAINPRRRFNIPLNNDYTIWDLNSQYTVDQNRFKSQGRATPYNGKTLFGVCKKTVVNNSISEE